MKKYILAVLALPALLAQGTAATYDIDAAHSAVTFKVAHMAISKVSGRFEKFSGTIEYTPGETRSWKTEAVIETASVSTGVEARDAHLRGPDFFDAEKFPKLTFRSLKVSGYKNMKGKLHGELTLHGVTRPIVLEVEGGGPAVDPWGNERMAATAVTTINRKDFGLGWNKVLETGGLLVGEKVEITLEIEAVKRKPEQPK